MNLAEITHPDRRVEMASRRYARTLLTGSNPHRGDGNIREQVQRYQEATVRSALLAQQVRLLLNDRDVPNWYCMLYANFARRVAKVMSKFGAKTRYLMVQEAVVRWQAYGCEREILHEVSRSVLGYDLDEPERCPDNNP